MIIMARPSQGLIVVIHIAGEKMKIKVSCCWTFQIASSTKGMDVGPVSFVRQEIGAGGVGPQVVVNI